MDDQWVKRAGKLSLEIRNFVDGRRMDSAGGPTISKYSPRDGKLLYALEEGADEDHDAAVCNARRAFEDGRWSEMALERRKEVLHRFASLITSNGEELALLETLDVGKPISDVLAIDVPLAAAAVRYNAEAVDKVHSKVFASDGSSLSYGLRSPVGTVAGIIGWNFALLQAAGKIGPVLAAGNSLVLKPSELASGTAARLAELALEAGVPAGVFNVVHGGGRVGAALAHHGQIDFVTFTGSSGTGKRLLVAAGESNMKRLLLECGGKSPSIVFDDCPDLDKVAALVLERAFWNQGQVCSASSRLLVHESIKGELLDLIVRKASTIRLGDPLDPQTRHGALISDAHRNKVLRFVETGEREGARLLYRSESPSPFAGGFYMGPVIFADVFPAQRIAQEEIFGPVLSVMTFASEEEAIRIANGTRYGLSAIVWTKDIGRAHRVTRRLQVGWVTVNATGEPKGGPGEGVLSLGGLKESGIGVEGGLEGLIAYTNGTAVQIFV